MNLKFGILLAGSCLLSACTSAEITQEPILYTASANLNEKGTTSFTTRAYRKDGDSKKELSGVPCEFKGVGFGSTFVTPAEIIAPDMGSRTPTASVTCEYDGQKDVVIQSPYNKTLAEIDASTSAAASGNGLIGALVGSIAAGVQKSRRDPAQDVYAYRDARITFEQ